MGASLRTSEGGPPLDEEALSSFEQRYGLSLPMAYKAFLLATNGGRPERDLLQVPGLGSGSPVRLHLFFGLNDAIQSCNLDWNLDVFRGRIPAWLLPIATTEGADKLCLSISGENAGALFYWDAHARAEERSLHLVAGDFTSLVSSLSADGLSPRQTQA